MKILAIGNSFSQDATRYLQSIAKADGENMKVVNLYIGGCPLRLHYINALEDRRNYAIQLHGESIGFFASIKEALISDAWDVVTVQQASPQSFKYDTYQPYLNFLADYVRKYCPKTKIYVHQTWAYEDGTERLHNMGYEKSADMFSDIQKAYQQAFEDIKADGMIPAGTLMQELLNNGIEKVHRDGFHASLGLGRYAIGLLWYKVLTGRSIEENTFSEFDEEITQGQINIVKKCVNTVKQI